MRKLLRILAIVVATLAVVAACTYWVSPMLFSFWAARKLPKNAHVAPPMMNAVALGSDDLPDLNSLSEADLRTVIIRFERIGCFGSCPAYTLTVHGDGRVEYVGKNHVKEKGAQDGRIEPATLRTLLSEFARVKFLSLAEDYSEAKCSSICTDMATAVTELSVKGVPHRVKHYYGCGDAPKALFDLEAAVDKSVHSDQWTGDVSKQGPLGTTCWQR